MVPGKYDISIYRGGSFGFNAVGTDGIGDIDFLALYDKARMHIRKPWVRQAQAINDPLFELTTENGRLTLTNNSVDVSITSNDTSAMAFNNGIYSLELVINGLTEADDIVDILLYGKVTVIGERTL